MKICSISDLHSNFALKTSEADVLTISGDLTYKGSLIELSNARHWLKEQPQKYKVIIAGNHDFCFENKNREEARHILSGDGIFYLQDESVVLDGVKFYGSPWQPWFYDWAFNLYRGKALKEKWDLIPDDVDVLLTHGPPYGYGDLTMRGEAVGCQDLLEAIKKKKPRYHLFGHIHENFGEWDLDGIKLINCNVGYMVGDHIEGNPVLFDIQPR